jgi:hypothetical protein
MARHGSKDTHDGTAGRSVPDGLASLLDTERALSEEVARAEREAAALIEAARAAVGDLEQAFASTVDETLRALEAAEEAATLAAIAAAAADATREVQRLESVPDPRVTELAESVLDDFLGTSTMSPGGRP